MLRALILGIVQGLTEFLPISSSAHLVLVPHFAGWPKPGLAFDVALHLGTLGAVVWHFRSELAAVASSVFTPARDRGGRRLLALLALGSVPVAVAGIVFEPLVERVFTEPVWTAGFLLLTAALLVAGELAARRRDDVPEAAADGTPAGGHGDVGQVGWWDSVIIGTAQALALLPGVSRSGSTIAAGLLRGVDRQTAARFSFLLSIPAITGAIAVQLPELSSAGPGLGEVAVGVLAAFVSGLWAIRILLRVISTRGLLGFAVYVTVLASVVFALAFRPL